MRPFRTTYMRLLVAAERRWLLSFLFGSGAFLPELERWQHVVPLRPLSQMKGLFFERLFGWSVARWSVPSLLNYFSGESRYGRYT